MTLTKLPNEQDPIAIRLAIQRLNKRLGQQAIPTFAGISVTGGMAIASTLTVGAISATGVISGGAGIFSTISAGAGSFTSANASGGVAVVSNLHVAAVSATGTISGGAGIFSSISAGAGSFTSVDASGVAALNTVIGNLATISSVTFSSAAISEVAGGVIFSGLSGSKGAANRYLSSGGEAASWYFNAPSGSKYYFAIAEGNKAVMDGTGVNISVLAVTSAAVERGVTVSSTIRVQRLLIGGITS